MSFYGQVCHCKRFYWNSSCHTKAFFDNFDMANSISQNETLVLNIIPLTLYCKVLLQYYSVLQSTTPVLLCTTKYILFQYYSVLTVLQRATPFLHCTTKQHSWLMSVAYETSFTMRGAKGVILQRHEILHLPRKMTVMIDPRHIWNVIYNERSNRNHNPSSPNTAPATQNECHQWSASHMKRHFQCAEQVSTLETHQLLRLPRNMNLMIDPRHIWNVI